MTRVPFRSDDEARAAAVRVVEVVAAGGTVLLPTESFYGLGTDPASPTGVRRVLALKDRPRGLALPVVCADWEQVDAIVAIPGRVRGNLERQWPGPLTVIAPLRRPLPAGREKTLAVRVPGLRSLRALLVLTGPLTATSANRHGRPAHTDPADALGELAGEPDLVLDGGPTAGGRASTLVDVTGDRPRVVRAGPVRWSRTRT